MFFFHMDNILSISTEQFNFSLDDILFYYQNISNCMSTFLIKIEK